MKQPFSIVISKDRTSRPEQDRLEKLLAAGLADLAGIEVATLPHLYDLGPEGPGMDFLRSVAGDMIVLSWLYPRSAFWVLDANSVRGRLGKTSSLPEEEPGLRVTSARARRDVPDRTIWCMDLRDHLRPEPYLAEIQRITGIGGDQAGTASTVAARAIEEGTRSRWYPVVDSGRCNNCMECLNFCLFGVFSLDMDERIQIEQPDACRPGCPACARVCPQGAIMFPQHKDPAIAGDPQSSLAGLKLDLSQVFGGASAADLATAERARAVAQDKAVAQEKDGGLAKSPKKRPKSPSADEKDDLDRLVDKLDEMEL